MGCHGYGINYSVSATAHVRLLFYALLFYVKPIFFDEYIFSSFLMLLIYSLAEVGPKQL
jgi:hypothetical protein